MARGRVTRKGVLTKWWESNKDSQFQIITYVTILSCASMAWGFIFLFMLGGATDPSHQDSLVPFSWLCLVFGSFTSFYTLPEFGYFWSQEQLWRKYLSWMQGPRSSKGGKRRRMPDILGPKYQSRLMGLYDHYQIRGGRRFKVDASPLKNPSNEKTPVVGREFQRQWWQTENSKLSEFLPALSTLKTKNTNRMIIVFSASAISLLLLNTFFGIYISMGGINHDTLDLSAYLLSTENVNFNPPHLDSVSLLLIAFFSLILDFTRPPVISQEEE